MSSLTEIVCAVSLNRDPEAIAVKDLLLEPFAQQRLPGKAFGPLFHAFLKW